MVAQFGSACVQAPPLPGLTCQTVAAFAPGASPTSATQSAATQSSGSAVRREEKLMREMRKARDALAARTGRARKSMAVLLLEAYRSGEHSWLKLRADTETNAEPPANGTRS